MLFSVVIPVYNVEKYLDQCIQSVLSQDYSDYEIILVDDGSTDSSSLICDNYSKQYKQIKTIHKENGGLSDARNAGIKHAEGDYICFIDSDDYWSEFSVLSKLSCEIDKKHPDIIRISRRKLIVKTGKYYDEYSDFNKFEDLSPSETLYNMMADDQLKESAPLHILSREFILKYNLFFKVGIKSEDIEWAVRVYSHEPKWAFTEERFYIYRLGREGSISTKVGARNIEDILNTIDQSIPIALLCGNGTKEALLGFIMYNTILLSAHVFCSDLSRERKKEYDSRLDSVCREYLTNYALGGKTKKAAKLYSVGGYRLLQSSLGIYLKYRGR